MMAESFSALGALGVILQGGTLAAVLWVGREIVDLGKKTAVHDEKHRRHDARLDLLEQRRA